MVIELVAILALGLGVITGCYTLHKHQKQFSEFDLCHLWALRVDALLYIGVCFSTSLCLVDIGIRITWLTEQGWEATPLKWRIVFLMLHVSIGILSSLQHFTTDRLLKTISRYPLCQRKLDS